MSSLTYGNGLNGTIVYDNQYRITGITAGSVLNLGYDLYDANANLQHITNTLDATKNKTFTYDALDRLQTAASGIWGSLGWSYDGVGNRQTENSNSYAYAPNTNKLTSANGKSIGYDNNGNTTTENARVYTYNQNQRMIQVVDGAMTVGYTYNGSGQRIKKVVNGTATIVHYNQNGQIIAESNSSGTITAEYVYLNGQQLAKLGGANTYYYHNDHLATPQKMTDASGTVVWAADYKPFGEATVTVSMITNNLRFPGQYYDAETGTLYNYFRDYDPATGRYIEADPIGLEGGLSQYGYANQNPLRYIDPDGKNPLVLVCVGGGCQFLVDAAATALLIYFAERALDEVIRQLEYDDAKTLADNPPPGNNCSSLSRQIDHAERVIQLYEAWDAKWQPGRHAQKIKDWKRRVDNLKEEYDNKCVKKCRR